MRLDELIVAFGPRLAVATGMLAAGYFAGAWAARAAGRALERRELEPPVRKLLESMARIGVFALSAILALQNLGVELLPLVAGLSVAGAAVALATQGVLGNVVAGLMIIFSRPFRVGDYLSVVGEQGEVLDIGLSNTTLGHADLSRVVIPNRKIVGEVLHNHGRIRQLTIEVALPYESDVTAAIDTALAVLRANARVLRDPAPSAALARFSEAGLTLSVNPWVAVADYAAAGAELNQALLQAFRNRRLLRPVEEVAVA